MNSIFSLALFQSHPAQAGGPLAEDWSSVLLWTLPALFVLVVLTAALDRWLARVLAPGDWPKTRRPSMMSLPAGADPNAEPRGRLVPVERVRRTSGGISQTAIVPIHSELRRR